MRRRTGFSWTVLGVVVVGGAVGVLLRSALVFPLGTGGGPLLVPTVTLIINVVGSFALGAVVGRLDDRRPLLRAFFGTGVMGGFTTYSAFAVHVAQLASAAPVTGILLALVTVFAGLLAAALGLRLGRASIGAAGRVDPPEDAE